MKGCLLLPLPLELVEGDKGQALPLVAEGEVVEHPDPVGR